MEIAVGPYSVTGTIEAWREMMARERGDALPLSQLPDLDELPWDGDRILYPVSSVE